MSKTLASLMTEEHVQNFHSLILSTENAERTYKITILHMILSLPMQIDSDPETQLTRSILASAREIRENLVRFRQSYCEGKFTSTLKSSLQVQIDFLDEIIKLAK